MRALSLQLHDGRAIATDDDRMIRQRFRARAVYVFIFVRNFSRGIFLGKSLSKVAAAAALQLLLLLIAIS
jgi:hypothetical protein